MSRFGLQSGRDVFDSEFGTEGSFTPIFHGDCRGGLPHRRPCIHQGPTSPVWTRWCRVALWPEAQFPCWKSEDELKAGGGLRVSSEGEMSHS